ncbi:UDP-N-acetylmuramoyl-L-alanyl-D-glutamate--L-lysine ligase [Planococcus massiliensis]|uniref:UDP-N-acetylmuramyl-tripeptide synthetase n=1 Tax=Planococcus massiliensis TaxID=1499687 RepID=A0A098ENM3_9BACL|nr:UDP-N-acetylmuramoyl-L-alanyl-D-glutamate--2,6-diaminopimelate ligase [Planococcus massiliensis]CEG23420.1 UDP-N-acetylmuramoyl-L-alanyl-D-glutamate--L-lysine ligase [Planococcus massiliensis]
MKTEELLNLIKMKTVEGVVPHNIEGIQMDSRLVQPGDIFVCIAGYTVDGHEFALDAVNRGASLIIAENEISQVPDNVCVVRVKDSAKVLARFAHHLHGYPAARLSTIGVTGTNGKTTVSHLIHELLEKAGQQSAVAGTLGFRSADDWRSTRNTTSDVLTNLKMLKRAAESGCSAMIFETSSQGLVNGRMWGVDMDIAVFTNLSHDHLDFHKSMESYGHAKGLLFLQLGQDVGKAKFAVLNQDDSWSARFSQMTPFETISYGLSEEADFQASGIRYTEQGTEFQLHSPEGVFAVKTAFIGKFNVYNVLAAIAALYAYGLEIEAILAHLPEVYPVEGRMEKLTSSDGPTVYIDYAHTPDAIKKAIDSLLPFKKGRLIILIAGGNYRDQLKRPIMAEKASVADYVIITTNNPGQEPSSEILKAYEKGMLHRRYTLIAERAEAVRHAIDMAEKDDLVLLTDKGHETTLLVGDRYLPYDEKEIVLAQLALHAAKKNA